MSADARGGTTGGVSMFTARAAALIAAILLVYFLKASRPVTLPLVAALFVIMLAWPLQRSLASRIPNWLAITITVIATLAGFALFLAALGWSVSLVVDHLREFDQPTERLRSLVNRLRRMVGLPASSGGVGNLGLASPDELMNRIAPPLYTAVALLFLIIAFVALGLAEVRDFGLRARERLAGGERLREIAREVAAAFRRFFVAKTAASTATGIASWLLALALGIDLAPVWGFTAFLLEFVPTIGSIIAVFPPTIFAYLQGADVSRTLVVFASYAVLQLFMGNIVDPRIEGRVLSISPVAVLVAIVFWGWVWGIPGAFLGVPVTVAIAIVCRHFERSRWVSELLEARDDREDRGAAA